MADTSFRDYVLEQLAGLRLLTCKRMFGGYGLYAEDVFFGIIHHGALYFRTDESSRAAYVEQGMRPFMPQPRQSLKAYYEVPADVLEDAGQLQEWARRAVAAKYS